MKQTRKQKGGSLWSRFPTLSFRLEMPSIYTKRDANILEWSGFDKSIENLRKSHLLELLEGDRVFCKLRFTPNEYGKGIAYLNYIECIKEKPSAFKRPSLLIMYKFLEILKYLGIEFVYFSVAAVDEFWKLYKLYHDMGFVCVHEDETAMNNVREYMKLSDLSIEFTRRTDINKEYFSKTIPNIEKMNSEKKIGLAFEMYKRCYFMFGSVEAVMNKIEKSVASQSGGRKKRKTRKNGRSCFRRNSTSFTHSKN